MEQQQFVDDAKLYKNKKNEKQRTLIRIIVLEVSRVLEPSKLLFISVSPPKKNQTPPYPCLDSPANVL